MRSVGDDARRYAWCRGQAVWIMGPPIAQWAEDVEGAAEAGQDGLVRHGATAIGQECAVMIALVTCKERPLPVASLRAAWALERIRDHELWADCWELVRGAPNDASNEEVLARCRRLVDAVRPLVGDVPDPLTPEGYFPALALARDWLKLLDTVGEEGFLPREWTDGK